jgi:hypothetical protein
VCEMKDVFLIDEKSYGQLSILLCDIYEDIKILCCTQRDTMYLHCT